MEPQYLTFRKFNQPDDAQLLTTLLEQHQIPFQLEEFTTSFDPTFAGNEPIHEIRVKILPHDFVKADGLLAEFSRKAVEEASADHYLFSFSDEELMEIITKPDEWNHFDFLLAQRILKDRGKEVQPEVVELLKKQRLTELTKPEDTPSTWVAAGYIMAIPGGLLGLFIGWHLATHRKTLPNGDQVYAFSAKDRKHGNRIVILGTISIICWIAGRLWFAMD